MQFIVDNWLALITGGIAGFIISYILFSLFGKKAKKARHLSKALSETKAELERQQSELTKHFADSAELLDKMANDFRQLYQHMASKSSTLLSNNPANNSVSTSSLLVDKDSHDENENTTLIDLNQSSDINTEQQQSKNIENNQEKPVVKDESTDIKK